LFYLSEEGSQIVSLRANWEVGTLVIKF